MGLWSFGKDSEIGFMTRVVSAVAADGVRLRGKLTLHFRGPRARGAAEAAADTCAVIAAEIIAQAHDHRRLIGDEAALVDRIRKVLPEEFPPCRSIELLALHVVGEGKEPGAAEPERARRAPDGAAPAPERAPVAPAARFSLPMPAAKAAALARRRSAPRISLPEQPIARAAGKRRSEPKLSAQRRSETPPGRGEARPAMRADGVGGRPREPGREPPARGRPEPGRVRGDVQRVRSEPARGRSAVPPSRKPAARRLPRRTAALVSALAALPEGASVDAIRVPIGCFLRDASARLAIALVLSVDEPSFDVMTAIDAAATPSERADVQRLLREATACVAALFYVELLEADLPQNVAIDTLQNVGDSLPGGALPVAEISRYLGAEDVAAELASAAGSVVDADDPTDLASALGSPLFDLRERLRAVAAQVKRAVGL
jgi:hypothetical protein